MDERPVCSKPGCGRPVLARGSCRRHYYYDRYQAMRAGKWIVHKGVGRYAGRNGDTLKRGRAVHIPEATYSLILAGVIGRVTEITSKTICVSLYGPHIRGVATLSRKSVTGL